jgi:hypothetical protein
LRVIQRQTMSVTVHVQVSGNSYFLLTVAVA